MTIDRGAVAAGESGLAQELVLALLERQRVDDRAALDVLEARLDHGPLRRVDDQRHLGDVRLDGEQVEEAGHRRLGVEQRLVHVDVDHLGAALDLLPRDLDGVVEAAFLDQPGEGARAGDVGPLADVDEERIRADVERLEAATGASAARWSGSSRGGMPSTAAAIARDVVGRRAAAAADEVQRALAGELAEDAGRLGRLLVVAAERVGQAGVGVGDDRHVGDARQLGDVRPEHPRAERAVEPDANGRAWRTLFQKAPTVWPESVLEKLQSGGFVPDGMRIFCGSAWRFTVRMQARHCPTSSHNTRRAPVRISAGFP